MKPRLRFNPILILVASIVAACGSPATAPVTDTPAASPTETSIPPLAETATSAPPSATPTPAILPLEILEWTEWPIGNPADPANTDTHVEALIRNPNDFIVRVDTEADELRFVNAVGEVVYANPSPFLYLWQGEWLLPGEITGLSACVCFWSSGLEKQEWVSFELDTPLERADDIAYTPDVEFRLGEIINLANTHLGGSGIGLETFLTNTSDQVLESIPTRVLAYDAAGRYVGVATFGNAVVSFRENIGIQPGDTATGIVVSDIDYIDINVPLSYVASAIGIPFQETAEPVLPSGTPLVDWGGIPIMPGAIAGETIEGGYEFTTAADLDAIIAFYQAALSNLGFEHELALDEGAGYTLITFHNGAVNGLIAIVELGGMRGVAINIY